MFSRFEDRGLKNIGHRRLAKWRKWRACDLSVVLPTSQLILQPFRCFTYVTAHSLTLLSLLLRHWFFTYVTWAHSPTFQSLHLRQNSLSNPAVALPTSQHILQPFRCLTYITAHSLTLLSLLLRHWFLTYVTWRAAHGFYNIDMLHVSL